MKPSPRNSDLDISIIWNVLVQYKNICSLFMGTRLNYYYVTACIDWLLWWFRFRFGIWTERSTDAKLKCFPYCHKLSCNADSIIIYNMPTWSMYRVLKKVQQLEIEFYVRFTSFQVRFEYMREFLYIPTFNWNYFDYIIKGTFPSGLSKIYIELRLRFRFSWG